MTHAVSLALASAALFALATPAAKLLLGTIHPFVLAGLLYCGAGVGVAIVRRVGRRFVEQRAHEVPLQGRDFLWLAGAIACGGVAGPLLMMLGLDRTEASAASLLLTFETAATALMAWFLFRENFDRRVVVGMACLVFGALVLAWSGVPAWSEFVGPLAIVAACIAWGLDNNLTRRVSLSDPLQIVELKGLVAGPVNLALGLAVGGELPSWLGIGAGAAVGFIGYGLSLVLFIFALRDLGAARTGAYYATAPFMGAAFAVLLLREPLTLQLILGGALMAVGVWLHLTEHHEHEHEHEPMTHAHPHVHDEHHQHEHRPGDPPGEPHTHVHEHARLRHSHPHVPDMHHRHGHS